VGQVEECLLSKHEVLGSNLNTITNKTTHKWKQVPSTKKKKKKKNPKSWY
jgi:hypothetical protein